MANFAAADLDGLVRIVKRKLKKIQYWPHLIDDCLAGTGLKSSPGARMHYEFNLGSASIRSSRAAALSSGSGRLVASGFRLKI
jgi:hypothetical protein